MPNELFTLCKKLLQTLTVVCFVLLTNKMYAQTGTITAIAGLHGSPGGAFGIGDGRIADSALFFVITAVCVDTSGDIFLADAGHFRIRKISAATGLVSTIAGNGIHGDSCNGCYGPAAKIGAISGMCLDKNGNVFIVDANAYKIKKINITTGVISTVGGNGSPGISGDGGPATLAALGSLPGGVTVDKIGNIYFSTSENTIRKIDTSGIIHEFAGVGVGIGGGFGGDGGPALSATFSLPKNLASDKSGNIYVADVYNARIRKIDTTGIINTVAGNSFEYYHSNLEGYDYISYDIGQPAINSRILDVSELFIDSAYNIYFSAGSCIKKINAQTGIITEIAGDE